MIKNFQFWKKANDVSYSLAKNMILHNRSERFNFVEDNHYNHIRDLLCFVLLSLNQTENKVSLLIDLTSNNTYSNIKNENIDLDYIEILIRKNFFYGKTGEKVFLIEKHDN